MPHSAVSARAGQDPHKNPATVPGRGLPCAGRPGPVARGLVRKRQPAAVRGGVRGAAGRQAGEAHRAAGRRRAERGAGRRGPDRARPGRRPPARRSAVVPQARVHPAQAVRAVRCPGDRPYLAVEPTSAPQTPQKAAPGRAQELTLGQRPGWPAGGPVRAPRRPGKRARRRGRPPFRRRRAPGVRCGWRAPGGRVAEGGSGSWQDRD